MECGLLFERIAGVLKFAERRTTGIMALDMSRLHVSPQIEESDREKSNIPRGRSITSILSV